MAVAFLQQLEGFTIRPEVNDHWKWAAEPSGCYSTKSAYKAIHHVTVEDGQDGKFKELWKLRVPLKVAIFMWRLIQDKLPTKVNLKKKRVELQEYLCPFCRLVEETCHLFFHCSKISPLWWESQSWVNMMGVFPYNPDQHFIQHICGASAGLQGKRWQWWWFALTYSIWKHRNNIIFSNAAFDDQKLMEDAVFMLWSWLRCLEKNFSLHFNQWSSNLKDVFLRTAT
ncbi:uncharacterized protein LOC114398781 [Glycine soja]|uniref:uncharacterized protein LOC114398781 n=1 Tax=Glycine soja TaxID=3848 RepID=UPI00103AD478|nr:uncharacterized protein LOC114398781 [Glycine soja]